MENIRKSLELPKQEYYETHLSLINCILPIKMTPMEIKVMASFMALDGNIVRDRFGTTGRKIIREQHELSYAGLGNYIKAFKDKEFIIEERNGEYKIIPLLFPEKKMQYYSFRLINTDNAQSPPTT